MNGPATSWGVLRFLDTLDVDEGVKALAFFLEPLPIDDIETNDRR